MKVSALTELLLRYQKTKAKLKEFATDFDDYPNFRADSDDLLFFTMYLLSEFSEATIENNTEIIDDLKENLKLVAEYYDSCFNSCENHQHSDEFLLIGASAYFLMNEFGSAKVLSSLINKESFCANSPQKMIVEIINYTLSGKDLNNENQIELIDNIKTYFSTGINFNEIINSALEYRDSIYKSNDIDGITYVDILVAIIITIGEKSAWKILTESSNVDISKWEDYLVKNNSIKIFWKAQELIAKCGMLNGKSGIVQLPTGVGKTKSIELIIESALVSERANNIIIVSPLRALCNEISTDLDNALDNIVITPFSDVLQTDFDLDFLEDETNNVVVCTPEKLSYVLYHQSDIFEMFNVIIFDEAHMFDDDTRGVNYELLISEIKSRIDYSNQQLVLLSAVLPNSDEIKEWIFEDEGVLAIDKNLKGTPKSFAFASSAKDLHYYSNDLIDEDYFVPNSVEIKQLQKLGRERKERYFPDVFKSFEVALYYSIKLCHNGGVAIYVNRTDNIQTILEKLVDINRRGYDTSNLLEYSDPTEVERLHKLFVEYYGENHIYSIACQLGAFPHYSRLPNGLRISVESAFKSGKICFVICTSTLAQGVNIPIKYLLITNNKNDFDKMQVREFQNLIGRTARSGMFTQGDIILTNHDLFDNRIGGRGYYAWERCKTMIDPNQSEPCRSSILCLVEDYYYSYSNPPSPGLGMAKYIIKNYMDKDDISQEILNILLEYANDDLEKSSLVHLKNNINSVVKSIESYLCYLLSETDTDDLFKDSITICENSLAYKIANDDQKEKLKEIFGVISNKIMSLPSEKVKKYASAMSGVTLSNKIEEWLNTNFDASETYSIDELTDLIVRCFTNVYDDSFDSAELYEIVKLWYSQYSLIEIAEHNSLDFKKTEKICMTTISYNLSFFIGSIIDLLELDSDDENYNNLCKLQKMIKYGVSSNTEILICDHIFNDRVIANNIESVIGSNRNIPKVYKKIKQNKDEIINIINDYPSVFVNKILEITN